MRLSKATKVGVAALADDAADGAAAVTLSVRLADKDGEPTDALRVTKVVKSDAEWQALLTLELRRAPEDQGSRHLQLCVLRSAAVLLAREVRLGHGLAEFLSGLRCREHHRAPGLEPGDAADGDPVRSL
jgi:hypothetical protein